MDRPDLIVIFENSTLTDNFNEMMKFPSEVRQYRDWNEEKFIDANGPTFMSVYKSRFKDVKCQHPELFFSLFMNDWFDPKPLQNYKILKRIEQYDAAGKDHFKVKLTEKSLLLPYTSNRNTESQATDEIQMSVLSVGAETYKNTSAHSENSNLQEGSAAGQNTSSTDRETSDCFYNELFRIFNTSNNIYNDVCLRIFCHILIDLELAVNSRKMREDDYKMLLQNMMGKTSSIINGKLRESAQTVVIAYIGKYKDLSVLDQIKESPFKEICRCLRQNEVMTFREEFTKYINSAKADAGDFYYIVIHHNILIMSMLASRLKLHQTFNFILQEFPYVGLNSSCLNILDHGLQFRKFKVFELKNEQFEKLVCLIQAQSFSTLLNIFSTALIDFEQSRKTRSFQTAAGNSRKAR